MPSFLLIDLLFTLFYDLLLDLPGSVDIILCLYVIVLVFFLFPFPVDTFSLVCDVL